MADVEPPAEAPGEAAEERHKFALWTVGVVLDLGLAMLAGRARAEDQLAEFQRRQSRQGGPGRGGQRRSPWRR